MDLDIDPAMAQDLAGGVNLTKAVELYVDADELLPLAYKLLLQHQHNTEQAAVTGWTLRTRGGEFPDMELECPHGPHDVEIVTEMGSGFSTDQQCPPAAVVDAMLNHLREHANGDHN
jgi:hypothetical protein